MTLVREADTSARLGGLDLLPRGPLDALVLSAQRNDDGLDGLVLGVVADAVHGERAGALDRLAVERLRLEVGEDGIAGPVVAAVEPGVDLERLAGDEDRTGADDSSPALVGDFRGHGVLVVLIAMQFVGDLASISIWTLPSGPTGIVLLHITSSGCAHGVGATSSASAGSSPTR